jgi:hypothetical protein
MGEIVVGVCIGDFAGGDRMGEHETEETGERLVGGQ